MPSTAMTRTVKDLRVELTRDYVPALAKLLPSAVKPERVITLVLIAASREPKLLQCTPESIALSMLRIAQWDLEIGTTAHLVPFGDVCTPIADWKGLVQMILRSPKVKDVQARIVFSNEYFKHRAGDSPMLEHEPIWGNARGDMIGAYAIAFFRPTGSTFDPMSKDEIDAIRASSKSKDSPAWKGHYHEMAKKTVIRRLAKRMPQPPTNLFDDAATEPEDRPSLLVPAMAMDQATDTLKPADLSAHASAEVYGDDDQAADDRELALQDERKAKQDTRIRD